VKIFVGLGDVGFNFFDKFQFLKQKKIFENVDNIFD
jgi:hypothetical protein